MGKNLVDSVDSNEVKYWLELRHAGDIYAAETLLGNAGNPRFDFWAMKPTWRNILTYGYEIKVTRHDFVSDTKWMKYLGFCNEFYFVCPHGLILEPEIPKEAGLIYCPKSGGRLYVKKKSPYRDIPPKNLSAMLIHVLMWRYKVNNQKLTPRIILKEIESGKIHDMRIKKSIARQVDLEVSGIKEENEHLKEENDTLSHIQNWATRNKIDFKNKSHWELSNQLEKLTAAFSGEIQGIIAPNLIPSLERIISEGKILLDHLNKA